MCYAYILNFEKCKQLFGAVIVCGVMVATLYMEEMVVFLGNALSGQVWRSHTCRIDDLKEVLLWGGEGNWGNGCGVAEEGRRGKLVGGKAQTGQMRSAHLLDKWFKGRLGGSVL